MVDLSLTVRISTRTRRFRASGCLGHVCINKQSNLATDNVISRDKGQDIFELFPSPTQRQTHPHKDTPTHRLSKLQPFSCCRHIHVQRPDKAVVDLENLLFYLALPGVQVFLLLKAWKHSDQVVKELVSQHQFILYINTSFDLSFVTSTLNGITARLL